MNGERNSILLVARDSHHLFHKWFWCTNLCRVGSKLSAGTFEWENWRDVSCRLYRDESFDQAENQSRITTEIINMSNGCFALASHHLLSQLQCKDLLQFVIFFFFLIKMFCRKVLYPSPNLVFHFIRARAQCASTLASARAPLHMKSLLFL